MDGNTFDPAGEMARLRRQVEQLKQDLGHGRNEGYTLQTLRDTIAHMLADYEKAGWLEGCEPDAVSVLRHLKQIAHADHASDLFGKQP